MMPGGLQAPKDYRKPNYHDDDVSTPKTIAQPDSQRVHPDDKQQPQHNDPFHLQIIAILLRTIFYIHQVDFNSDNNSQQGSHFRTGVPLDRSQ
jgi:hypothetical protein